MRLPIPPRPQIKMEVPAGLEPAITELQSVALPSWLRNLHECINPSSGMTALVLLHIFGRCKAKHFLKDSVDKRSN